MNLNAFVTLLAKFIQVVFLLMCLNPVILLFFHVKINQATFIHLLKSFSFKVFCINTATCFSKSKLAMLSSMKYTFWTTLCYSKGNHISLCIFLWVCNIIYRIPLYIPHHERNPFILKTQLQLEMHFMVCFLCTCLCVHWWWLTCVQVAVKKYVLNAKSLIVTGGWAS